MDPIFLLNEDDARAMAQQTKGYSFAFQVLGYFTWKHRVGNEIIQQAYKQYLDEYVYEKIWSELSAVEQRILYGIAKTSSGKVKDIREFLDMETNYFNPYRNKLKRRGLINGDTYGYVSFTLPLFDRFVLENYFPENK